MRTFWILLLLGAGGLAGAQAADPTGQISLVPAAGTWPGPVTLSVTAPAGTNLRYRFLESPSPALFPWPGSLVLDCLPGETRSYALRLTADFPTGESVTRDYRYQVNRPVGPSPSVRPVPGTYLSAVTVNPVLPPGWTVLESGKASSLPVIFDAPPGVRRSFVLEAWGPSDQKITWRYTVDRRDQEVPALEILSPVPGRWSNAQVLAASFQGVDQVFWAYGPELGPSPREYTGPVVLEGSGARSLTMAARIRGDGRWITRTVSWTSGTAELPAPSWPISGVPSSDLVFPAVAGTLVSWDEGRSWQPSSERRETLSKTSRKVVSVQIKRGEETQRFLYWLDNRAPQTVELESSGGWNPLVSFSGSSDAFHRVTWTFFDGRTSEDSPGLWGPRGTWKVPDGAVAARVTALTPAGLSADSLPLGFPTVGWVTPDWEPWDRDGFPTDSGRPAAGGRIPPRPGFRAVYEVSETPDVPEPSPRSPLLDGVFLPTVPWGADRTFYARFAWRDEAGLVGPATTAVGVRVDRIPPGVPEVVLVPGQAAAQLPQGEEQGTELEWAVTSDRVLSSEGLVFRPYRGPLDTASLRNSSDASGLWLHIQARDPAGNLGQARLNVALAPPSTEASVVHVDPDPLVGELPVTDGAVYPWPQFRLRIPDAGPSTWVGVTDAAEPPSDWSARMEPWSGLVSRAVARGDRRSFVVFWNQKTEDGWAFEEPRTVRLTLDQGPPAVPVFSTSWPTGPRAQAWNLSVRPGQTGDSLRYSYTLDGSLPADPLSSGQLWPGEQSWDVPAGTKAVVRVRLAAVSAGGLSVEVPLTDPVVIDRTVPPVVSPGLETFTWKSAPWRVPVLPEGPVRYTITSDGSAPEAPTAASALVPPSGLVLEGVEGQSVLYRLRWRAFSDAGVPGPPTESYSVLLDRSQGDTESPASSTDARTGAPRILGVPGSGVGAGPIALRLEGGGELVRYELREGVGSGRSVSASSPLWPGTLVLDGGEGIDRTFSLSVRGFTGDGSAATPEIRYSVRVDRSRPAAPEFSLAADSRRPEAVLKSLSVRNPDETLYYRWSWVSFPQGRGDLGWTPADDAPPVFVAPGGALTRLRVEAFLRDEAGNEGPVASQEILVDQNVVYLAPLAAGDGTRTRPAGSVAEALAKARREGRSLVLAAAGTFGVSAVADVGGLQIYGGLDSDLWETSPSPGRTVWTAQPPFSGRTLLESGDRDWTLDKVDLVASGVALDRVIEVRGADALVRDSTWSWQGTLTGWSQSGGSLTLSGVAASFSPLSGAPFLELSGVEFSVRGLHLAAVGNRDGMLIRLADCRSLLRDLSVVSKKAVGFDGVVSVQRGSFQLFGSRILAADGADRGVAFALRDAEAQLWNSEVALYGTQVNTGFQQAGGTLEVQKSSVSLLQGQEYNQALTVDRGETIFRSCQIKVETGAYQGALTVDTGRLTVQASRFQLAGGGLRAWGGQFLGLCRVTVEDSTWTLGTKTPGGLWILERPWAQGSSVSGSTLKGW